jgi:phosphate-selective porin
VRTRALVVFAALLPAVALGADAARSAAEPADAAQRQRERILAPDLAADERDRALTGRPELFVQAGFAAEPIAGASPEQAPTNFSLYRMESRWAGRVAERIGLGFEIQYHTAADSAVEELVNDAFVDYYASDALTLRFGQFVKPFGFDVQQSSSVRESPERGIFAGYFFPGQRDRGAMLAAKLGRHGGWLDGASVYAAVLNGNRFFNDDNDAVNVNLRFRKVFAARPFAIGASYQYGSQLLPPGVAGSDRVVVYGLDAQWLFGRLGIRGEWVRGTMPSTLLSAAPEFTAAFAPGAQSWGAAALFDYQLANADVYWRWDRFGNDPVSGKDIRAFNVGWFRELGEHSRLGFDYQWKNDVSYNDDELNTQFSFRWNVVY